PVARVAFIVDELFEDAEFRDPYERCKEAGHEPVVVGRAAGRQLTGKKGMTITTDTGSAEVSVDDFDALVIPGGFSPDKVRTDRNLVELTRAMDEAGKPVAAICHAGWVLAEADVLHGRTVTSYHSIRTDLKNAGATWVDEEVVEDGNLITSRNPGDIPAFCDALLKRLG
ncbi:MAG: type 1 glutamine amidotransferase domain-containing protein, partial [Actinomycetota bacterium]